MNLNNFFWALDDAEGPYPLLNRARTAFEALHDDIFSHGKGETEALRLEIGQIVEVFDLDCQSPPKRYIIFCVIVQELNAVFANSKENAADILFRWG
jgi:hypothetical protein